MTEAVPERDGVTVAPTADVDTRATIGAGTRIWHLAQIREEAVIGDNCTIGRGAYVGPEVVLGDNVKLQNYALVYEPARLGDGVFIGPAAVLTNDEYPRAITPDGRQAFVANYGGGTISVQCEENGDSDQVVANAVISAIKVDSVQ